jgi:hypothetical protein
MEPEMKVALALITALCAFTNQSQAHDVKLTFKCPKAKSIVWETHPTDSNWTYKGTVKYWDGALWSNSIDDITLTKAEAVGKDHTKEGPFYYIKCQYQMPDGPDMVGKNYQYLTQNIGYRSLCESWKDTVTCNP